MMTFICPLCLPNLVLPPLHPYYFLKTISSLMVFALIVTCTERCFIKITVLLTLANLCSMVLLQKGFSKALWHYYLLPLSFSIFFTNSIIPTSTLNNTYCLLTNTKNYSVYQTLQFSCSVVSNFLQPHELQHARLPCLSPTPRACWNSCPLSQWCHPTISPSAVPFSSYLQSFPASGYFPMRQFFAPGGQSIIGALASVSVLPMNIQDWFPLGWTILISLQSKGLSRIFSNTTVQKRQFFGVQHPLWSNSHIHTWLLEKQ